MCTELVLYSTGLPGQCSGKYGGLLFCVWYSEPLWDSECFAHGTYWSAMEQPGHPGECLQSYSQANRGNITTMHWVCSTLRPVNNIWYPGGPEALDSCDKSVNPSVWLLMHELARWQHIWLVFMGVLESNLIFGFISQFIIIIILSHLKLYSL